MHIPSGFCMLCAAKTSLACHRCGDFYCSKECQLKDWQRHRYICFSIPPLVHPTACSTFAAADLSSSPLPVNKGHQKANGKDILLSENVEETEASNEKISESACVMPIPALFTSSNPTKCDKKNNTNIIVGNITPTELVNEKNSVNLHGTLKKGDVTNGKIDDDSNETQKKFDLTKVPKNTVRLPSGSIVSLMGFMSPNSCFVRDTSESAEKAYFEICKRVNLVGHTQPKKAKIKPLEYALAYYNGQFHRAKGLGYKFVTQRLLLLDEGIFINRKNIEMRETCKELLELPWCSLQVQLKDVPNFMLNDDINKFLKQFEGSRFTAEYAQNGHVQLRYVEKEISLNAQICEFCSSMNVYSKQPFNKQMSGSIDALNQQVCRKDSDALETPIEKCEKPMESNHKTAAKIKEETTKSPQLNNDKAVGVDNDQSPKTDHDPKETNLDSLPIADEKTKDNANEVNMLKDLAVKLQANGDVQKSVKGSLAFSATSNYASIEEHKVNPPINRAPSNLESLLNSLELGSVKGVNQDVNNKPMSSPINMAPSNLQPLLKSPFEQRHLSTSNKYGLDAIIVDNANVSRGIVGAFDSIYANDFSKLYMCLSEFNDSQPYRPILNEYVIAKLDNSWHRAQVMEIKGNHTEYLYTVMYFEFTNVATVFEQDIRRYPVDLSVPCFTNLCLIEGFPHRPTKKQIDYLNEKLQRNSRLHIDSVNYLQNMALINCKTLIDELNKML